MVRSSVSLATLAISLSLPAAALARPTGVPAANEAPAASADAPDDVATIVVTGNQPRTSVELPGAEIQKILPLSTAELALNVTNLTQEKGKSTLSIGSAVNGYSAYPIPPRQFFVTLSTAY